MLGYSEWACSLGGEVGSDLMMMEFESKGCGCVVLEMRRVCITSIQKIKVLC